MLATLFGRAMVIEKTETGFSNSSRTVPALLDY